MAARPPAEPLQRSGMGADSERAAARAGRDVLRPAGSVGGLASRKEGGSRDLPATRTTRAASRRPRPPIAHIADSSFGRCAGSDRSARAAQAGGETSPRTRLAAELCRRPRSIEAGAGAREPVGRARQPKASRPNPHSNEETQKREVLRMKLAGLEPATSWVRCGSSPRRRRQRIVAGAGPSLEPTAVVGSTSAVGLPWIHAAPGTSGRRVPGPRGQEARRGARCYAAT
jgi:hypothetical protein